MCIFLEGPTIYLSSDALEAVTTIYTIVLGTKIGIVGLWNLYINAASLANES